MKLDKDSWHVKLNDYVYGKGYSHDSNNLCPYFWGTWLAIFLLIPSAIAKWIKRSSSQSTREKFANASLYFWYVLMIVVYVAAGSLIAGFIWAVIFGVVLFFIKTDYLENWLTNRSSNKPPKPKKKHEPRKPSMTVEMMRGWKNKHCPRIEWE